MRFDRLTKADQELLATKRSRDALSWNKCADRVGAKDVNLGERCYLARRKTGMTVRELARAVGTSHVSVIKRERNAGEVEVLAAHWRALGVRV